MILNKSRAIRIDQRRNLVASLLLRNPKITQREICSNLASKGFVNPDRNEPYSLGTINSDVKELQDEWRVDAQTDIAEWKAVQLEQINEVIRQAWKDRDLQTVLRAIKMQSDIIGTNAPIKTEHSGEITHKLYETISPDDWDEEDE